MGELGENESQYHRDLGEYIYRKNNKARVITIGTLSKNISSECNGKHFDTIEDAILHIKTFSKNTKNFLKASRSMKFEKIIELLK